MAKAKAPKQKPPKVKMVARKKSDKSNLSFDLLYQLSYMSVIAAGGVPRAHIFERAAQLPCSSAEYFRKVELACRRLKFDYAQACRYVGDSADNEEIKGLLLRLSSSLLSGEPEADFLAREAKAIAEKYENEYGRQLEAMKMWTDAYVSLILSAVLVIIIGVVSTMIWKIETAVILGMAFTSVMTTGFGVWLIRLMTPRETVVLAWAGSREQKFARQLFRMLGPLAVAAVAVLLLVKASPALALLAVALFVLPIGVVTYIDSAKVAKRDDEVGVFLRSLGGVCAALGTTVGAALGRLDLDAIHTLKRAVKRLHTRLSVGIRPRLSWKKFIDETGSELTNRSVGMFYDAIDLGGSAGQAGYQSSLFASRIALLRARRKCVSDPFRWLCLAMHTAVVVLLIFITEVISSFAGMVTRAEATMPRMGGGPSMASFTSFNISGLEYMHNLVLPLVIVYTVANAVAPALAEGGSKYKMLFNLSLTAMVSGVSLAVLPRAAKLLFASVPM